MSLAGTATETPARNRAVCVECGEPIGRVRDWSRPGVAVKWLHGSWAANYNHTALPAPASIPAIR